jgi:hypothetical protein
MNTVSRILFPATAISLAFASSAYAVVWNESINGDLSGSYSAPTVLGSLGPGTHSIIGGDSSGSRDIFTFTISAGMSLVSVFNVAYSGADGTAFIGIASGTSINDSNLPGSLLGYTHFGTVPGTVGTEIIDNIAVGAGSATFIPPLGAGTYTVWMQQAGAAATWQMDFIVVPEPAHAALLLLGLPWLARRRR